MKQTRTTRGRGCTAAVIAGCLWLAGGGLAAAHCDTMNGPVIPEARAALEKGDVTPVLKWVKADHAAELKAVFELALAARSKGAESRELADRYFLETLVRLHRAGEGAPYTGIKDEPAEPVVVLADEALATGSLDKLLGKLTGHLGEVLRGKFARLVKAARGKNDSVAAGREFVAAYVDFTHTVEAIHAAMSSGHAHETAAHEADEVHPAR